MISHEEYMKKLSPERQAKIKANAKKLIDAELTLRELRKELRMSQEAVADSLGIRQGDLSKFERRSDALLSTIRRYVEALGGKLELVAQIPGHGPVKLTNIGFFEDEEEEKVSTPKPRRQVAKAAASARIRKIK